MLKYYLKMACLSESCMASIFSGETLDVAPPLSLNCSFVSFEENDSKVVI